MKKNIELLPNIESFFGKRDENLHLLEDGLNVSVELKSNGLELEGAQKDVARAEQILLDLIRDADIEICVQLCLCRDRDEAIRQSLPPGSIVLLNPQRRWWPGLAQGLARKLRRDGHHVMFPDDSVLEQHGMTLVESRF